MAQKGGFPNSQNGYGHEYAKGSKGFGKGGNQGYDQPQGYGGSQHKNSEGGGLCGKRKEAPTPNSYGGEGAMGSGKGFGKGGNEGHGYGYGSTPNSYNKGGYSYYSNGSSPIQNNEKKRYGFGLSPGAMSASTQLGCGNWIIFAVTCVFCGFFYHNHAALIWSLFIACGLIGAVTTGVRFDQIMSYIRNSNNDGRLFWTLVPAWILLSAVCGFGCGIFAHERYLRKFWLSQELIVRQNVLPSEPAAAYARAGEIGFAEEARIDLSKTIGYKDFDVYCVAPIAGDVPLEKVQFWAAGMNCCGARSGFVCDDAWDPKARAGIILHDNEHSQLVKDMRPYYMKAVKMAEATYSIASVNEPVFVKWVADPDRVEWNFMIMGFAVIVCCVLMAVVCCTGIAIAVSYTVPANKQDPFPQSAGQAGYPGQAGYADPQQDYNKKYAEYEQQYQALH